MEGHPVKSVELAGSNPKATAGRTMIHLSTLIGTILLV